MPLPYVPSLVAEDCAPDKVTQRGDEITGIFI